jgi:RimJ/RimL family protein N-acetyltransferase
MTLPIRLLRVSDVRAAGKHIERHALESGRGSDIVFAPFADLDRDAYEELREESWRRATDVPGWERCFGAFVEERVVGHVDLTGGSLYSALHRARLGIGVEREFRGQGVGTALIAAALAWARRERKLRWIELSVFAHNQRALLLYERLGFREIGRTPDAYRVGEHRIDDVHMALSL